MLSNFSTRLINNLAKRFINCDKYQKSSSVQEERQKHQVSVISVIGDSYQDDVFIMFRTAKAALLQTTKAIEKSIQVSFGSDASADADRRSRK